LGNVACRYFSLCGLISFQKLQIFYASFFQYSRQVQESISARKISKMNLHYILWFADIMHVLYCEKLLRDIRDTDRLLFVSLSAFFLEIGRRLCIRAFNMNIVNHHCLLILSSISTRRFSLLPPKVLFDRIGFSDPIPKVLILDGLIPWPTKKLFTRLALNFERFLL
jgi:hypothetical protein